MKKLILFTFISFLFISMIHAQPKNPIVQNPVKGLITGVVIDETSKKPLEYANATLYKSPDSVFVTGATTDVTGRFVINDVPAGNYYLVVKFIGYKRTKIEGVKITENNRQHNAGEIKLEEASNSLKDIAVTAEKNQVEFKIDKKVINVAKLPNAAGGTAVDALRNVPTVAVDNEGNVTVRGSGNFTVLVDGKPSALSGNDILKQIPANLIENIEIITNPSAKYDPDGTSGIINVIMKKGMGNGFNGIVNAMAGTGNRYSGDFLFNFKKSNFSYFFGAEYRRNRFQADGQGLDITSGANPEELLFDFNRRVKVYNGGFKGGIDLYLNKNNTLSFSANAGQFKVYRSSTNYEDLLNNTSNQHSYKISQAQNNTTANYFSGNVSWTSKFNDKGHQLYTMLYYSRNEGDDTDINESFTSDAAWNYLSGNLSNQKVIKNNVKNEIRFKIDYTLPIGDSKIELGQQTTLRPLTQGYNLQTMNIALNDWIVDQKKSNFLDFYRNIYAAYATYTGKIKGFQFQIGLRGEYMDRMIELETTNESYNMKRFDIYPSFSVSHDLSKTQSLQASFSKRVNQPNEFMLNPFLLDFGTFGAKGNPNLIPEFINSYELNYMNRLGKGFISLSAFFRQSYNSFSMFLDNINGKRIQTSINLNSYKSTGVDISSNLDLAKWWNIFANVSIYNYDIVSDVKSDNIPSSTNAVNLRINSTFRLKTFTTIMITGFLQGENWTTQGKIGNFGSINFSIRQELSKQASVVLNVSDPFKLQKFNMDMVSSQMTGYYKQSMEAPIVQLSFSYRFNNYRASQKTDDGIQREMNQNGGGMF